VEHSKRLLDITSRYSSEPAANPGKLDKRVKPKKRKEQKRKFDFSTVKNKKHLSIIKDYLDGNYTYEELGNKYNCTRQNIGTILTNYRIRNNK
jgi:hypothetical protein